MNKFVLKHLGVFCRACSIILFIATLALQATAQKQTVDLNTTISMSLDNSSVQAVLNAISKKSGIKFVYSDDDIASLPRITAEFKQVSLQTILNKCFENSKLRYKVINDAIIIEPTTKVERITIYGVITDKSNVPLPGASVILKGTNVGASADGMGRYKISFAKIANTTLLYRFIGSESQEVNITKSGELNVKLKDTENKIEDIVVNGMYSRNKNTFTGSVTTITSDQILSVSSTNAIAAIAALTPGMVMTTNNAQGSNPNVMPELLIRGAKSVVTKAEEKAYNNPLIILDGIEISMEELYDLDIYEIERVDVLKDATATIAYGDRATNGVIIIERQRVKDSKIRLSYNFVPDFSIAELSSMNLCNASQKLELERLSGIYDDPSGKYDKVYASKLQNVRRGVNTNWIEAPLRTAFSHSHSVQLSGRGQNLDYRAAMKFSDAYGVMKGDNRQNYNLNFSLGYHLQEKLTISYRANYTYGKSTSTPYGSFSDYANMNPYYPVYDEYGKYIKAYDFYGAENASVDTYHISNPLYNATLSSFNKSRRQSFSNSIDAKWYITKLFYITGQFNLGMGENQGDNYTSPMHSKYLKLLNPMEKGEYVIRNGNTFNYDGKIVVNYAKNFKDDGSGFIVNAGADFGSNSSNNAILQATGFMKDRLSDIKYAGAYSKSLPSGEERLSTKVGFFVSSNIYFKNRYFADISFRTAGSSTYGANNRFAPIWAAGLGWNIHKENFMKNVEWLDVLRLRASFGYTGSVNYSAYDAMTTYKYNNELEYYTGIGANPIQMGNPNLSWQRTFKQNYGFAATILKERINFSVEYYTEKTTDMLMSVPVPASTGISSAKINFGELQNSGIEMSISGKVISTKNFSWFSSINGSHSFDKLNKISDVFKEESYKINGLRIRFKEGGSQNDIYAVRSAGIDPATGKEIFINSKGEYTYEYSSNDEVVVGNSNPALQGSWLNTLTYKGLSLSLTFSYRFGSDTYNSTIQKKVELINVLHNVDARAFTDRWKQPGDLKRFLAIAKENDNTSSRFIERDNELFLSNVQVNYEFSADVLKKIGIKRLSVGFGISDILRLSNVKYERGTEYPYERSFNITFRPTF